MKLEEQERIKDLKRKMIRQQNNRCFVCNREFGYMNLPQMSHRICKAKWLIKKYGKEIIHHEFNMRITCAGNCNDHVSINPESLEAKELIEQIRNKLNGNSTD